MGIFSSSLYIEIITDNSAISYQRFKMQASKRNFFTMHIKILLLSDNVETVDYKRLIPQKKMKKGSVINNIPFSMKISNQSSPVIGTPLFYKSN
jgi:hypothetical protein